MAKTITLFENQTANGTSPESPVLAGAFVIIKVTGAFDGAIITLAADFNDNDFATITDITSSPITITSPTMLQMRSIFCPARIRAIITTVGASTDITLKLLAEVKP